MACDSPCRSGHYGDTLDNYCHPCKKGTYNYPGSGSPNECIKCSQGYWGENEGQSSCSSCGPGYYGTEIGAIDSSTCKKCGIAKQSFNERGSYKCIDCPVGTASDKEDVYPCPPCPDGFINTQTGKTSCTEQCPEGTSNSETDRTTCPSCKRGYYNNQKGQLKCTPCGLGKTSINEGSKLETDCQLCPKGTYNDIEGNFPCIECQAGTMLDTEGAKLASDCIKCPPGMYQDKAGQDSCIQCEPGTYSCNSRLYYKIIRSLLALIIIIASF